MRQELRFLLVKLIFLIFEAKMKKIICDLSTESVIEIPLTNDEIASIELEKTSEEQKNFVATQYQRDRALEYPPIADYLDGIVKNDQAQIQAYINACLAVKTKYPKK